MTPLNKFMKIYMAPMEGLTGHVYRKCYEKYFAKGRIDKYFIPFISPNSSDGYTTREVMDINPDNNKGLYAVPQIMANSSEMFLKGARMLKELGYNEINLNAGCPSGTVVSKGRGAGFLGDPDKMDIFFQEIFSSSIMDGVKMSVKTRLGIHSEKEFDSILKVYNKYSFNEVIIHARVRADQYNGVPRMGAFYEAMAESVNPVGYNGDIWNYKAYDSIVSNADKSRVPDSVMIGRGFIADPGLINAICPDSYDALKQRDLKAEKNVIKAFMQEIFEEYLSLMDGDPKAMHKMKEMWLYLGRNFKGGDKCLKEIKKAQRISDYNSAVITFFANADLKVSQ